MFKKICLLLPLLGLPLLADFDALVVADEMPAMDVLARQMYDRARARLRLTTQDVLPAKMSDYPAVIVYIHTILTPTAEHGLLDYVRGGGRLVLVHHSISSHKRTNKDWLPALEMTLPENYKYFDPVTIDVVNLAPGHFITSNQVRWREQFEYKGKRTDGFDLQHTEAYLNHAFQGPRTTLLGLKFTDPKTGQTYEQDTAGWYKTVGKGLVFYFMPGHNAFDFDNVVYAQILANALLFKP